MTRLVLHIGDCKSGSTAIQSVLQAGSWTHRPDGAPQRLVYAQGGRAKALNHHRLSNSIWMKEHLSIRDQAWGRLGQEFRSGGFDILAVSSERFEFAPPEQVMAALRQFLPEALEDLSIIAYVRPHAARLLSGYAQNVKQGLHNGDLASFLDVTERENRFAYAPRLAEWRRVFGADTVAVRPMIRADLVGSCVVQDFLTFALDAPRGSVTVEKIPSPNTSLGREGLALLRQFRAELRRRNPARNPVQGQIVERFSQRLETMESFTADPVRLDGALAGRTMTAFLADAEACDRDIFDRPVMVPALEAAVEDARGREALPEDPANVQRMTDVSLVWIDMMSNAIQQLQRASGQQGGGSGQGGGRGGRPARATQGAGPH